EMLSSAQKGCVISTDRCRVPPALRDRNQLNYTITKIAWRKYGVHVVRARFCFSDAPIIVTPDYTVSVAKAWAAFTEVRRFLRNRQDVRYELPFPPRFASLLEGKKRSLLM
ncbi:hypothetical protein XENOCAPTIV_013182, partial [Xenoophorus captivus]